jgi:enhancing lycopene biosynthesis protein 2
VRPLSELRGEGFDALVLPGGFGVAKNLCDFAFKGSQGQVLPAMHAALEGFRTAHKPIGAVCIAPALLALSFPKQGFELTVGAPGEVSQEIEKLGHKHVVCSPSEIHVDSRHRVVSTPAYMYDDAPLHEVFAGIQKLVAEVIRLSA